jgi:hypothetical protein
MRVEAQYQFYFEYVLPRLDQPLAMRLIFPDVRAHVFGKREEDPLFPPGVDETLSNMELALQSVEFPQTTLSRKVRDVCIDRLGVVLVWTSETAPNEHLVRKSLSKAVAVANVVLDHLRVVARAPRLRRIDRYWKPGHSEFALLVPHTETWINPDYGSLWPVFDGRFNSTCVSEAVLAPETGVATTSDLEDSLSKGLRPYLALSLLVDAESALMSLRIREAILCIASALEVHANGYVEAQTLLTQNQAKNAMVGSSSFATRYFDRLSRATCGRSLHAEDQSTFDDVDAVYAQRNGLMHGGNLRGSLKQMTELSQHHEVLRWISSARTAIDWLSTLSR